MIGEMLVGPATALFMDEISTGLDSSTTYQIVNCLKQSVNILKGTAFSSLMFLNRGYLYLYFSDLELLHIGA